MTRLDLAELRLVAITDRSMLGDDPSRAFARALDGVRPGSVAIQVRAKDLDGGALLALARLAVETGAPVLVNDRVDVALASGACGVHLPEVGMAPADVRAMWPGLSIGASRHDAARIHQEIGDGHVDLVHYGPLGETPNKTSIGLAALRDTTDRLAKPRGARPLLVGVGGIQTAGEIRAAIASGCDAIAMIRAAWTGASLAQHVLAIEAALRESARSTHA